MIKKYLMWPEDSPGPTIISFFMGLVLAFLVMVPQIKGWDLDYHLPGWLWIVITISIIALVLTISKIMRTPT